MIPKLGYRAYFGIKNETITLKGKFV